MPKQCCLFVQVVVVTAATVSAQKLLSGHCPPVTPMAGFDRDSYMGLWYQQATIKSFLKDDVTCTQIKYKPVSTSAFSVEARKVAKLTNGPVSIYGFSKPWRISKPVPGVYIETLFGDLVNDVSTNYVLFTDYKDVSVVWSCDSLYKLWNIQNVQVLTRERTVNTTKLLASTLRALLPKHLDSLFDFLNPIDQSECEEIVAA